MVNKYCSKQILFFRSHEQLIIKLWQCIMEGLIYLLFVCNVQHVKETFTYKKNVRCRHVFAVCLKKRSGLLTRV